LFVALVAVAEPTSIEQIRLIPSEIADKESFGAGAGIARRVKRTSANASELRRKDCCYPLQLMQESAFKQARGSGQFSG
jgi:hypothetical protein